ncbi:MAG: hypothetical protein H0W02_22300 [Ktedonobacteraceae bacterium]|nr:hypothetical protein [Ktedonobacteraceae bacterium]
MSKQDDQFLPEQVDEQIETLAHLGNSSTLPEALLVSNLDQIYGEEHEIAERVWVRLNRHIAQDSRGGTGQKHLEDQTLHTLVKEARPMKTRETPPPAKKRWRALETFAAIVIIAALVGSMALLFQLRRPSHSSQAGSGAVTSTAQGVHETTATATAKATPIPAPPTSVMIRVSAAGISPTSQGKITIPSGTKVTLTVLPDHSLLPFQTFTMGIYATDPYGFSELQYCTYPKTDTCSYTIAYSSSEGTDYTKGKHTFRAFLGNIGGAILKDSSSVTITWS